jgi:hypothetical protein
MNGFARDLFSPYFALERGFVGGRFSRASRRSAISRGAGRSRGGRQRKPVTAKNVQRLRRLPDQVRRINRGMLERRNKEWKKKVAASQRTPG